MHNLKIWYPFALEEVGVVNGYSSQALDLDQIFLIDYNTVCMIPNVKLLDQQLLTTLRHF